MKRLFKRLNTKFIICQCKIYFIYKKKNYLERPISTWRRRQNPCLLLFSFGLGDEDKNWLVIAIGDGHVILVESHLTFTHS